MSLNGPATRGGNETGQGSVCRRLDNGRSLPVIPRSFYDTQTMELLALLPSGDPEETKTYVHERE